MCEFNSFFISISIKEYNLRLNLNMKIYIRIFLKLNIKFINLKMHESKTKFNWKYKD